MSLILETSENVAGVCVETFRHKLADAYEIEFKAKHNCRHCHGRGRLKYDNPTTGRQWVTTCSCVHRKHN